MNELKSKLGILAHCIPKSRRSELLGEWHAIYTSLPQSERGRFIQGCKMHVFKSSGQRWWRNFAGKNGLAKLAQSWLILAISGAAIVLGGLWIMLILCIPLACIMVGSFLVGYHNTATLSAMVGSAAAGLAATSYVWWASGVMFHSYDSGTPVPSMAQYGGSALIVLLLCAFIYAASIMVAIYREKSFTNAG